MRTHLIKQKRFCTHYLLQSSLAESHIQYPIEAYSTHTFSINVLRNRSKPRIIMQPQFSMIKLTRILSSSCQFDHLCNNIFWLDLKQSRLVSCRRAWYLIYEGKLCIFYFHANFRIIMISMDVSCVSYFCFHMQNPLQFETKLQNLIH